VNRYIACVVVVCSSGIGRIFLNKINVKLGHTEMFLAFCMKYQFMHHLF